MHFDWLTRFLLISLIFPPEIRSIEHLRQRWFFKKMGHSTPLFLHFRILILLKTGKQIMIYIKFNDDWIRTAYLWCRKQPALPTEPPPLPKTEMVFVHDKSLDRYPSCSVTLYPKSWNFVRSGHTAQMLSNAFYHIKPVSSNLKYLAWP